MMSPDEEKLAIWSATKMEEACPSCGIKGGPFKGGVTNPPSYFPGTNSNLVQIVCTKCGYVRLFSVEVLLMG
jgi:DNA-directed RNA polymerase subunit RPC12/RpoP